MERRKAQSTMKAIEFLSVGGPEVIHLTERPCPVPQNGEVLIRVAATGMNRADLLQRMGHHPPPEGVTDIPGLEVSGYVESVGPDTDSGLIGQPVCALLSGGGYAEYVTAPAALCLGVSGKLDIETAAALPEALYTVTKNVFVLGGLKSGEHLLINGGASGIGTLAVQMALFCGARVSVTAGSDEKVNFCKKLGATHALNYKTDDISAALKNDPVDVVLDMAGGETLTRDLSLMAFGGRHVSIAYMAGSKALIDISTLMKKHLTITGSMLRHDGPEAKAALHQIILEKFWPKILDGTISPIISHRFPLEKSREAHEIFAKGEHIGKMILVSLGLCGSN
jgi:NADPH2:quinone reductase